MFNMLYFIYLLVHGIKKVLKASLNMNEMASLWGNKDRYLRLIERDYFCYLGDLLGGSKFKIF